MDHHKVLGLERNASKKEIKEAFRRLALELHPDKHSQSSKAVRDAAAIKFRQLSEAYQFLIDDSKRSYYDRVQSQSTASSSTYGYGYGYYNNNYNHRQTYRHATSEGLLSKLGIALRFITPRAFLLNAIFAGALFGGIFMVDASGKALWKMRNSGDLCITHNPNCDFSGDIIKKLKRNHLKKPWNPLRKPKLTKIRLEKGCCRVSIL